MKIKTLRECYREWIAAGWSAKDALSFALYGRAEMIGHMFPGQFFFAN